MSKRPPLTQEDIDGMSLHDIRKRIRENEILLARNDERNKFQVQAALFDPEWRDIARAAAWATVDPLHQGAVPEHWPTGFNKDEFTAKFVQEQFAKIGQPGSTNYDMTPTGAAAAYLKRLG